jgi:hypothetical protein
MLDRQPHFTFPSGQEPCCDYRNGGLRLVGPRAIALVQPARYFLANGLHLNCGKGSPCDPNF